MNDADANRPGKGLYSKNTKQFQFCIQKLSDQNSIGQIKEIGS